MSLSIPTRLTRIVAVTLAAAGLAGAAHAAQADASIGTPKAKLTITQYSPGYHNVAVFGTVPMTQTEAQGLLNSGHKMVERVWGDDSYSDDLLINQTRMTAYATSNGLEFHKVILAVPDSTLDEDWGMDEIYAGVRLINSDGTTIRSAESNRWYDFY